MPTNDPSLAEVYARCVDIVLRVTRIFSIAHHGLIGSEFRCLEQLADDLLGLSMNIDSRQSRSCFSSSSDDSDGDDK